MTLAAFAAAGGSDPHSHEVVTVEADGRVRALVATAWPDGAPADQAGVFEWTLDDVAALRAELAAAESPAGRTGARTRAASACSSLGGGCGGGRSTSCRPRSPPLRIASPACARPRASTRARRCG